MSDSQTANEDYTDRNIRVMRFMATLSPAMSIFVNIGIVIVIWAGGIQSAAGGVSGRADRGLHQLPANHHGTAGDHGHAGECGGGGNRLGGAHQRGAGNGARSAGCAGSAHACRTGRQTRIAFEGVDFHYNGTNDGLVLSDVDLVAEPGQTVAILGATGAGKSSIVNLVPRFYDVADGQDHLERRGRSPR